MICAAIASLIEKKEIPNIWNMTLEEVWSKNIHSEFKKGQYHCPFLNSKTFY